MLLWLHSLRLLSAYLSHLISSHDQPQRLSQEAARTVEMMAMEYEESDQLRTPVDFKKFSLSFQVLSYSRCNLPFNLLVRMISP